MLNCPLFSTSWMFIVSPACLVSAFIAFELLFPSSLSKISETSLKQQLEVGKVIVPCGHEKKGLEGIQYGKGRSKKSREKENNFEA